MGHREVRCFSKRVLQYAVDLCKHKGNLVAVKTLNPTSSPDSQELLEDFAKEAKLLQFLHHRCIMLDCPGKAVAALAQIRQTQQH